MRSKLKLLLLFMSFTLACGAAAQTTNGTSPAPQPKQEASTSSTNSATIESRVERYLRNLYAWGPTFAVKVGPSKPSPIPGLLEVPVAVSANGQTENALVYASKDGDFLIRGELDDMSVDPFADIRSKLHTENAPSMGPADAKITLVEFADFECPSCRQMDRLLRDFMPKHPDTRLVYKSFPLTELHPWAMTAALAGQCTYNQDPAAFWKIHDAIFDAQDVISPSNVWDKMMDLATQLGLKLDDFRACMASPETARRIQENIDEGKAVNITATPTTFLDGRRIVGPDESLLNQFHNY